MSRRGKYQYKNKIIKQLHLNKEKQKNNMKDDAQLSIGSLILVIVIIIIIAVILIFIMLPPSCDESEQVELVGVLYGFEKNNTMWDVKVNNVSYHFNYFDKSYMERLIGFSVTITCYDRNTHYDYLSAYVNEVD